MLISNQLKMNKLTREKSSSQFTELWIRRRESNSRHIARFNMIFFLRCFPWINFLPKYTIFFFLGILYEMLVMTRFYFFFIFSTFCKIFPLNNRTARIGVKKCLAFCLKGNGWQSLCTLYIGNIHDKNAGVVFLWSPKVLPTNETHETKLLLSVF